MQLALCTRLIEAVCFNFFRRLCKLPRVMLVGANAPLGIIITCFYHGSLLRQSCNSPDQDVQRVYKMLAAYSVHAITNIITIRRKAYHDNPNIPNPKTLHVQQYLN